MGQKKYCSGCAQNRDCKTLYEQVGKSQGPDVALGAITAFLLPIVVFIAALGLNDYVFKQAVEGKNLRFIVGFALAGCASFIYVLIVKAIKVRLARSQGRDKAEGDIKSKQKAD
ncbi:MAG: hypothetical protein ACYTFK_08055 [Planctomycetota bacterium]|jgi:hypothetical protein